MALVEELADDALLALEEAECPVTLGSVIGVCSQVVAPQNADCGHGRYQKPERAE